MAIPALAGCDRKASLNLPQGYKYWKSNSDTRIILVPDSEAVKTGGYIGPGICSLGVKDSIVFGEIRAAPKASLGKKTEAGFFILDATNHVLDSGMTREVFDAKLKKLGIENPELESLP